MYVTLILYNTLYLEANYHNTQDLPLSAIFAFISSLVWVIYLGNFFQQKYDIGWNKWRFSKSVMQRVHGICIFYSLFFVRGTAQCSSSATCRSRGTMKIFTQIFGDREDYIQETLEPDILSKVSEFISSKQLRCGLLLSIRTQLQIKNYWGPWISILFADVAVYADVAHIELLAHNQLSPSTHLASQSSLDTHNQAYGLKCNRKSRVPKWITRTNEDMKAKIAESGKFLSIMIIGL